MSDAPASTSSASPPDLSGRRLGDYAVLRRLGQGGMAVVYLAEQTSLRRQVALKVLNPDRASDDSYVRRFHVEAQAAAALVHPCIAQIYEVGCIDSLHFISQEYVPGQNLRQLLARHGPPDTKLAVHIIRQTAAALQRASEQGIVHRDIKPDNILITKDGQVKVADFGLARIMGDERGVHLTQVGMTLGTPLYMSPEQFEGKPLDPRSDVYSLGVTSYHLLAGNPPFRGETALAVAVQHVKNTPDRLENLRPDLPGALCRIIHKMLAKQPHERQQSAADVLRELRGVAIDGAI
ncbi:MAG: serine/threonine-protein kinase, partial [Pirellulales bacterium]